MWIFRLKRLRTVSRTRAFASGHYSVGSEDFRNSPAKRSDWGTIRILKNGSIPVEVYRTLDVYYNTKMDL